MSFSQTLSTNERAKAARNAIYSALSGCIPEMAIDSGAVIVVYITMLNGSDAIKMLATTFTSLTMIALVLFCGKICNYIGLRAAMTSSCLITLFSFLLMALAPFLGQFKLVFLLIGCFIYNLGKPLYTACWFPLIDNFLRPEDRSKFFGRMRFCYSTLNAALLFGLGWIFSKFENSTPPMWLMQSIIVFCGLAGFARCLFANKIPINPDIEDGAAAPASNQNQRYSLREGLGVSLRNGPLVGFSIYFCFYSIVSSSIAPLIMVYLKSDVFNATSSAVMRIAAISLSGALFGFLSSNSIIRVLKVKGSFLLAHLSSIVIPGILFFCSPAYSWSIWVIGVVSFISTFVGAISSVLNSSESLALARPGNKTIALSFFQFFSCLGVAAGRFGITAVLACGMLTPEWIFKGIAVTKFQSIFAISSIMMAFFMVLIVLLPAFVPKHEDYYEP